MIRKHAAMLFVLFIPFLALGATLHVGKEVYRDVVAKKIEGDRVTVRFAGGVGVFRIGELIQSEREEILKQLNLTPDYLEKLHQAEQKAAEAAAREREIRRRQVEPSEVATGKVFVENKEVAERIGCIIAAGVEVFAGAFGEVDLSLALVVYDVDFQVAIALRGKGDPLAVRRPGRGRVAV